MNTIRTSASNFRKTIERCEAHVQSLSVWVDNDHVALLNAIATVCRRVEPRSCTNLYTLTVEIDNLHSYSVRELLAIIPDCSIPAVDQALKCPAIGLYTLAIPRSNNHTITLRLEHTLLHPAWQIASTATRPLPPETDPQDWIPASVLEHRRYNILQEVRSIYAADTTAFFPSSTNSSTSRTETLSVIRSRVMPNLLRRFIADRDKLVRLASTFEGRDFREIMLRSVLDAYWWEERSPDGHVMSFHFNFIECLKIILADFIAMEGGEGVYDEGYMNGLRERITELLVLNFGDRKKIVEAVDEFRCSVVAAKNRDASFARILEREQRLQELRAQAENSQRLDYARARSAGYLAPGW